MCVFLPLFFLFKCSYLIKLVVCNIFTFEVELDGTLNSDTQENYIAYPHSSSP